jgi:ABC-2 type transport system permease protein
MLLATWSLWSREIVRFVRQRSRVVGALGSPVLFWILIGSGLGRSFQGSSALNGGYLEYFYPGTLALIVLFTAIFSTISIIEDRHEGFLQGVLVAPISRAAIVLSKILGSATLAIAQAAIFLLAAPIVYGHLSLTMLASALVAITLLSYALSGVGFSIAWMLDSTQGFHAIMNLLLVPMWLLSGALFPASGASGWVQALMAVNPLTYGVAAIRTAFYGSTADGPGLAASLGVLVAWCVVMTAVAVWQVDQDRRG